MDYCLILGKHKQKTLPCLTHCFLVLFITATKIKNNNLGLEFTQGTGSWHVVLSISELACEWEVDQYETLF